ncbi:Salicylaldehyde dehydrogenase [Cladobotryum mycophilum]|uniref:Salicylaldehyde dehydrogenase n=1 Tax=Cladobotryum mycophilum TaxID=491253 RepID=A0ABR0SVZ1_9HYPO
MSFVNGPNGEQILPIKIAGVPQPLDLNRLIPVQSSITGSTIHYAQSATPELATKAAEASYAAFQQWRKTTHTTRRELLIRAAGIIESREERFVEMEMAETSCSEDWARFNVKLTARCFKEIAANISHATTGELPPLETPGALCLVYQEPVGPILAISPWNASMVLCGRALAGPIGAGCSVVLKASELCPRVHHHLVEALEEAGLPAGVVNVVQASREDGPAVTEALISHRAIRKVEFTGSAAVGKIIGQLASKYLKPVLMELGGKAPAIVLKDADVKLAAQQIAFGAMLHHGQICMSTDRIVVVQDVAEPLIQELKTIILEQYANGAGHAATRRFASRAHDLLQKAHDNGAEFIVGDGSLNPTGSGLTPTIITNVKLEDDIFSEEIFAPAAILTIVADEDEAVRVANDTHYGLNASVHSKDVFAALRVAKQIEAGQVHIGSITQYDEANIPIGGTKGSGWGRNNGKFALREFLEEKTISIHDPQFAGSGNRFGKGH